MNHEDQDGIEIIDQQQTLDDSFEIYFDKNTLVEYLHSLEEDNLFRIHLVQEDEQALDKLKKAVDSKIKAKEQEIEEVNHNIEMLMASKNQLMTKQAALDTTFKGREKEIQETKQLYQVSTTKLFTGQ
jgi:hypothetical protein